VLKTTNDPVCASISGKNVTTFTLVGASISW
jgi:hypothetical protein